MGEVSATEDLENGRVALVRNFKTNTDTYLDSPVNETDLVVFLELSDSIILTTVDDVFEDRLSEVFVPSKSEPVECDHCGRTSCKKAIEVTVFTSGLLETIEQTSDDKRVVGMQGGEQKYHCKTCFEEIRELLEYHVRNGSISSELTIRNL